MGKYLSNWLSVEITGWLIFLVLSGIFAVLLGFGEDNMSRALRILLVLSFGIAVLRYRNLASGIPSLLAKERRRERQYRLPYLAALMVVAKYQEYDTLAKNLDVLRKHRQYEGPEPFPGEISPEWFWTAHVRCNEARVRPLNYIDRFQADAVWYQKARVWLDGDTPFSWRHLLGDFGTGLTEAEAKGSVVLTLYKADTIVEGLWRLLDLRDNKIIQRGAVDGIQRLLKEYRDEQELYGHIKNSELLQAMRNELRKYSVRPKLPAPSEE